MSSLSVRLRECDTALKVDEVSRLLSVSLKHLYRMVSDEKIPYLRLGGCIRFDPGTLADWLDGKAPLRPLGA